MKRDGNVQREGEEEGTEKMKSRRLWLPGITAPAPAEGKCK